MKKTRPKDFMILKSFTNRSAKQYKFIVTVTMTVTSLGHQVGRNVF